MMKTVKHSRNTANRGFTLLELLITLAVMAILVSWGFPSLQESIRSNRMIAQNNEMMAMLQYARSEAIRRNDDIEVHFVEADDGWEAYITNPGFTVDDSPSCPAGQLRCTENDSVLLDVEDDELLITFNNRGYIRDFGDTWASATLYLEHENCSGQSERRRIDVMPTGQINSCRLPCGSVDEC
jgi:type IV fimbrial biogenesis protein FimT